VPYITQDRRTALVWDDKLSIGDVNFLITNQLQEYLEQEGLSYKTLNEIIGVLECAKQEFYRRVVVPYEDKKKEENGDVYTV
jgi:hypothetical protein